MLRFKVHKGHTKTTEKVKGHAAVGSFGRDADTLRTVDYGRQFIVSCVRKVAPLTVMRCDGGRGAVTGNIAPLVECLPRIHEDLASIPSTA